MLDCSTCQKESENIHVVFIDEYFRTYRILCEECFQNFVLEWKKTSNLPVPEYVFPNN